MGTKKLSFFFVEKVESKNQKKLTFVAKDDNNNVVAQSELDPNLISKNYEACVV